MYCSKKFLNFLSDVSLDFIYKSSLEEIGTISIILAYGAIFYCNTYNVVWTCSVVTKTTKMIALT